MKRNLKPFTSVALGIVLTLFITSCNWQPSFLVAGKIKNCQELAKRDSYSPQFWIHNPDGSNQKIFIDGYELKISKDAKYPQGDQVKCVLGGSIEPWGDGAVQVTLDSYGGPGLVEIKSETGETISHQLSGASETVLVNLSPKHSVEWEVHTYSPSVFGSHGSGGGSSEQIKGLGFSKPPSDYSSDEIFKFGESVPGSITVRTRNGVPMGSRSRLGLSAELLGN